MSGYSGELYEYTPPAPAITPTQVFWRASSEEKEVLVDEKLNDTLKKALAMAKEEAKGMSNAAYW